MNINIGITLIAITMLTAVAPHDRKFLMKFLLEILQELACQHLTTISRSYA
jgi:hypothetical protein